MALPFKPKRLLSEEDVKRMLGIENFRQLDKKTTIEFISSISQMDPEVAVKALEQFPELGKIALGIAKENREALVAAFEANDKSSAAALASIDSIIAALSKELDKDELTTEERKLIIDTLSKLAAEIKDIHKSNQKFFQGNLAIFATITGAVVLGAIAVLGGNGRIQLPDFSDINKNLKA